MTKLQQWRAICKMSKRSHFDCQDASKLLSCEELNSGALREVSPVLVLMVRSSSRSHVPSSGGVPVLLEKAAAAPPGLSDS